MTDDARGLAEKVRGALEVVEAAIVQPAREDLHVTPTLVVAVRGQAVDCLCSSAVASQNRGALTRVGHFLTLIELTRPPSTSSNALSTLSVGDSVGRADSFVWRAVGCNRVQTYKRQMRA